jgi:trimeric autotransporter adhesin
VRVGVGCIVSENGETEQLQVVFMKKSSFSFLSVTAIVLATASSALATASVTTLANATISADTVGGVYSNLTGPVLTEGATADIGVGTIILTAPVGFQFNPAATVNVVTSRTGTGTSPLLQLASQTATVTTSNITVTSVAPDGGSARTVLTWTGIQVRATAVSPLATNNLTLATAGTCPITGITKGTTSFGTLSEVAGVAGTKLGFTTAPAATNAAGVAMANIVVQVQGSSGNNVASNNVAITVTLNTGSFASGSTNATTGPGGSATFSNLVINAQGNYTLTASAPTTGLSNSPAAPFVVVAGAPSTFQFLQDAPSSILAGTTFPSAVTVQLSDAFGNLISNKTVTLSLLGGGTLSGTTSQPTAGSGVATFGGLSVAQAGTNKALVASISSPSLSITGATFTVTAGSATKLGYTTAPAASTPAGVTMASIVVQIQDAAGNSIASNGVPITVALNAGAFTSGTTTILTAPNGSATFTDLLINASGNYTLTASSAGNIFTATPAAPFTIATATPSVIQITQDAPAVTAAGTIFSPAVTVHVADSLGNPATNTLVSLNLLGGGSLSGTVAHVTDVTGVATFNNLSISLAGTNYALVANSVNSLSVTGNTFIVTAATGSKLVYTSVPAVTNVAGSTLSNFVAQVQDPFNNNVPGSGVPIALSLGTGTFASGTTSLSTDPNGSATFSGLIITNAGNNAVTASSAGLTSANKSLVILPAPFTMTFQQDAPSVTNAGAVFTPAVAVKIVDAFNNTLTNRPVTLSLLNGGTLGGTTVRTTGLDGVASFSNLFINVAGTNYALLASATNSMSVTGATFIVTPAPASKLIYTVLPPASSVAGATLTPFTVQIADQFNNSVATNGVLISMGLTNGTFASGTISSNSDVNGSASFSDLVITNAGNNILIASASGLTSTNRPLVISPANLALTLQQDAPAVTNAGATFTPAVAVRLADQFNNVVSNRTVTLSLLNGGTLNGTLSRSTTNNGVATFNNLSINVPGTNYALVAVSTNSLSVTGQTFTVTVGAPSKLMYTTLPPSTVTAGGTLSTFVVQVEDQFSNFISGGGVPITLSLNTGAFGSGTTNTVTDSDGSVTFIDVVINAAGTYTMTANSPGLTAAGRLVTVVPAAASSLTFVQQPPAVTNAGAVFTPAVTVKVTDQFSNAISNMPVIVSLTGAGTLSGTLSRTTATNGIATFNNLSVNLPGTGDFLTAITTNPALSVNSANFNINVGPLDHYLVSATTPQTRGTPFTVTVTAQDVASNTVNNSSTVVTLSGSTANVQFDSNGDSIFGQNGDNTQVLSNGTFTISTIDNIPETITVTASDGNGKTGTSPSIAVNAAAGDYRSTATGNWNAIATWQTWNGAAWVAASTTPAGGAGTNITIQSTHTVTDNVAVGLTGTLIAQGSLSFSGGSLSVGSGGTVLNSGTINSTASTLIFNSGGTYDHNYTTASGTVPTAAWNTGSTCAIVGFTTFNGNPAGVSQNFYNFVWNCPNQSTAISLGGALTTVNGDFTLVSSGSGTLEGGNTATLVLTVAGNVNILGGALLGDVSGSGNSLGIGGSYNQTSGAFSQGSGALAINFTGANKAFIQSGGTLNTGNMSFSVTNNASLTLSNALSVSSGQSFTVKIGGTLNCITNVVSGSGTFTLNSGGSLGIGSIGGIASSGATGNVQTTTRSFSTGGNYTYNGSASQATGNGLPASVNSLTITNSGGTVTLGASVGVTSNLTVSAGAFDLGSFTANRASNGGTVTVANSAALKIGGTNTFPTNYLNRVLGASSTVEYEGSAQNVSALAYGNLTTSGSSTKTLQTGATTLAGDLTIGPGTTFDAGTNSFSVAGNLTNNGTAFAFSGPQTVTFNGSVTQNIAGASSTAFNTVAINSGSVLNLAANDTALGLIITNVNQGGGIWGATGSGATTIDNTDFQGTGTLTVSPPTFGLSFIQDAPAVTSAGTVFSPPVTVQMSSSASNLIVNQTVTLTLNGGGFLNGTTSQLIGTNGVATFTNLNINVAGTNYSLTATVTTPSLSVTGATFVVTTAPASKLVYTGVPATTNIAGSTLSAFTVQFADQFNNSIATNGVPITMSLSSGTFAGGTTPVNTAPNGSATFTDLVITNAGNNTLAASAAGVTSANMSLVILPAPYAIAFQQDAPSVTNAGATFSPAVAVRIADAFNNVLSNQTVTLSLLNGGTLNGTLSRTTANNGVATFNNLSINVVGTNYALVAASINSLSVTGNTFTVTTAAASKLAYTTSPVATNTAGQTLPTFVVQVTDQFNNNIATNGLPVTMSLSSGTFASGNTPVNTAPNGSATFSDLVITNAGNNILTASATGLTSTNKAITILNTAISNIAFIQDAPSVTNDGAVFTPSVTVKVTDTLNNGISNATVNLSLNGGGTLNGTLTHATAGNGVATFNNLSVNQTGNAYALTASTTNSLSVTGHTFAITVGPITRYVVSATTPQTRRVPFGVTVTAQDVFSNTVPDSSTVVTVSGSSANAQFDSNGDSIFGQNGDNMQVLSNGTFTINTEDTIAETITVTAADGTGKTGTSPAILVNAASGDFRSAATGNWNATATWQTWNGSSWVAASTTPAGGVGTNITIQSTHTVTDNVAVGLTGTLIDQGTASFSAGGSITVGSGGLVQNSGGINSTAATLIFNSGGTYQHNFTTTPGSIPISTWNAGSTVEFIGFTSGTINIVDGTGWNQVFQNVIWNCPNMSGSCNINPTGITDSMTNILGNLTVITTGTGTLRFDSHPSIVVPLIIGGDFVLQSGTFDLGSDAGANQWILRGNYLQNGGTVQNSGNAGGTVIFAGANKTFTRNSGTIVGGNYNFIVTNNASLTMNSGITVAGVTVFNTGTLNCGTNVVSGAGTFALNSGGALGIGSTGGITSSGATGNVQTTTRTFNTGGIYIYNGSASQATGNGLPATVSALIVTNTGGTVSLGATVSVTSNLTVSAGTFDLGSFTANRATSGGTLTVANAAALKIGGTNPFPFNYATHNLGASSTIEYEGSAQNVSAQPYGNLSTSGSGIKTLQAGATTIAGELSIGSGTTFAAGTNNFSIAGDWSNDGNGFTFSGSQTVTFNGSSPQNVDDGTSLTTFNNVAINSNSVLNLAFTGPDTALALTIAGVNKAPGTWGATGSGATHIDNAHFQGVTGTLNVTTGPTSTTTLSSTLNPATYGQSVTFTATVAVAGGIPPATGTVTFMAGVNTLGIQALSGSPTGTAAFVASGLLPSSYSITAVYSGDGNFPSSTSGTLSQQVNPAPLTITANSTTKTYGQTVSFAGTEFTNSALVGGDSVISVTLTSDGVASNAAAGNHSIIPSAAVGTGLTNYTITYQNGTLTVNQATVIGSITATNKVYDGTTTATISGYLLSGVLFGDDVSLTGGTANFIDQNVGNNKSVTATGLTLGGSMAGDYVLASSSASTTASITPATLTVSADNKSRPFGQPNPPLTASYSGFGTGDNTNVLSGTPSLSTSADTNSAVGGYPINIIIGSLSAANYTFAFTNGMLTVTKAFLTVTADNQSRPYGATNPVFTATFSGFFNGDATNVVSGAPNFTTSAISNSPVAGNPYTIIPTNGTLIATNYDFAFVNGQLTVTPASVSGSITASNKVYDGTNTATISSYSLSGVLFGDDASLTGGTATFIDKNVGNNKLVTVTGLALSGTTTGNYALASSTTKTTANITAYPITVTATTNTKPYDQTTSAAASPTITSGSLQGTDSAGFSEAYSDKNVATGKTLTPSGSVVDGNTGNNYTVTFLPDTTGVINALALTVSATGVDKVYDGTTNATVTLSDNRILGDNFSDTYTTASFADANAGSNKTVSVSGIAISGPDAINYTANTTASTTANITLGSLTISADNKAKTAGLPNPSLTASYVGFVGGDNTNALTTQATLSTTATTNSPVGTYPITASGAVSPNYTISYNSGTLTVVAVPQLTTLSISGNQFIFSFPTLSNQLYQVEYKDDLTAPTWTLSGGQLPGTGGSITVTNAITGSKRFFQVEVMPGQ